MSRSSAQIQSSPVSGFPPNIASTHSTPPSIHSNLPTSPLSQQKSPNQQNIPGPQMQHSGLMNQFLSQHSADSTLHQSQQQPMFHHQTPFSHHHQQQQSQHNQQLDQQLHQQHPQGTVVKALFVDITNTKFQLNSNPGSHHSTPASRR